MLKSMHGGNIDEEAEIEPARNAITDAKLRGPDTRPSRQTPLFHDPMPERVEPCLATLAAQVPAGAQWAFEIKWDGYRLHIHVEPSGVRIITRGGHDWTHRFPAIATAAAAFGAATAIIDGEAVVLDEQGRSTFSGLQQVLGGRGGKRVAPEALFYAFDIVYLDGVDLRASSLVGYDGGPHRAGVGVFHVNSPTRSSRSIAGAEAA